MKYPFKRYNMLCAIRANKVVGYILYKDLNEAIEKFNYIMNNEDELISIAQAGYELSKMHTYTKRLKKILNLI